MEILILREIDDFMDNINSEEPEKQPKKGMQEPPEAQADSSVPSESNSLYQAWGLTKMRYEFSLGEKNIFLKVIEVCQRFIKAEYLGKDNTLEMIKEDFGEEVPRIEFSIKDLLKGNSNNYEWVKQNLESLGNKYFGIPKEEGWDFAKTVLFSTIEGSQKRGKIRVTLTPAFWKAFFNLKVFKIIDTTVAYQFRSIYTERIYELLVGNRNVVTYDIIHLKNMFCVEEKYKNNGEFMRRVINSAQKEMRELDDCPFYFEYTTTNVGRRMDKIHFTVIDKKEAAEANQRLTELRSKAEGVKLSADVLKTVQENFPKLVIREDVELKLKQVQKLLGVKELCKKVCVIKEQADKLNDNNQLKGTVSAYFIGSLDKIADDFHESKSLKTRKMKVTEAVVVEENTSDGYEYFSLAQISKKAKLAGMDLDEYVKASKAEKMDDNTFRVKI